MRVNAGLTHTNTHTHPHRGVSQQKSILFEFNNLTVKPHQAF